MIEVPEQLAWRFAHLRYRVAHQIKDEDTLATALYNCVIQFWDLMYEYNQQTTAKEISESEL